MFTPFETPFDQLTGRDLGRLRDTPEGWYVEYKRELPNAAAIAKTISAFANTYGGWLFIGIDEASRADAVAGSFPGLALAGASSALQCIRQAVSDHMNPAAHFEARALAGGDGAGFSDDRVVICVRVPQSPVAPHIHRSGKIYRRVGDGSEPENDRHMLDQLFRRADDLKQQYSDWLDRDPEFSQAEDKVPYLRLMITVDPWQQEDPWLDVNVAELSELFNKSPPLMSAVPFDAIQTSERGYLARQVSTNNPHLLGLSWQLRRSLTSDIIVPLRFSDGEMFDFLKGYEHARRFRKLLHDRNFDSPRIVDLNMVYNLLVALVEIQRRLLDRAGWTKPYHVKARLLNVWRTVPFLDIPEVLDEFETHGIPMCMNSIATAPLGREPDSFAEIPQFDETDEPGKIIWQALVVFNQVAQPWGIPTFPEGKMGGLLASLSKAGTRAMQVQENARRDD
ncbi:MAG: AlbA family DNA-binding domain-containing protein [Sphingopyxis sp.]